MFQSAAAVWLECVCLSVLLICLCSISGSCGGTPVLQWRCATAPQLCVFRRSCASAWHGNRVTCCVRICCNSILGWGVVVWGGIPGARGWPHLILLPVSDSTRRCRPRFLFRVLAEYERGLLRRNSLRFIICTLSFAARCPSSFSLPQMCWFDLFLCVSYRNVSLLFQEEKKGPSPRKRKERTEESWKLCPNSLEWEKWQN